MAGPTELRWNDPASGPVAGGTAAVRLTGAEPGALASTLIGLEPIPRPVSPFYPGFGGGLAGLDPGLAGCHQWTPLDAVVVGTSGVSGGLDTTFDLVSGVALTGMVIGVQGIWLDTNRPGLPVSISNGLVLVVDNIAVGNHCGSVYFPGTATYSPWPAAIGQMPVVVLEHN